ncbi:VOC family protein [Nitrobacter sp.]|uniref:VOC family protein n=1 Tax=Nitrobacter sp. TaxID=29420 RepID=UPI0029CAB0D5|nr:VOC family protein [Nitrobacter sp.]
MNGGINHVGLSTRDMDGTIKFYTEVLDFEIVRYDRITVTEGGSMRHLFLDSGNRQLVSFLGPEGVEALSEWETGINQGLGVPRGFYHFAFGCDSEEVLVERQQNLLKHGISVSEVINHDWCKSIYFDDPVNKLSLEYCAYARAFNDDDRTLSTRFESPLALFDYDRDSWMKSEKARFKVLEERARENSGN